MAQTLSSDLYRPEVWADLAAESFVGKAVVATSSATVNDDTLAGQPGDTVNFPKWMTLGELDDLAEGTAITPVKLTQKSSKATIKEAGKGVEITDKAKLTGIGNAQDEAIRQFGQLAARKVDADLITAAVTTIPNGVTYADGSTATASAPLSHTIVGSATLTLTWDALVDAFEKAGDDFEPDEWAGLYIRAEQRSQVWKDDDFIRASEISAGGGGSVVGRGFIGTIGGLNVFVTNRLASNKAVILKRNALGLLWKRRPIVEQDRDILARSTIVTTNLHYATKRLDDKGVIYVQASAS
ncbi:N4-gp56 family major capsid protein [Cellulosimicrobium cellulans]|uniref:N4-gp56 family major capsid protein n=1 Tax=Cellulosimicrobium cellulans TaxID=1710 RepID=UPI00366A051A